MEGILERESLLCYNGSMLVVLVVGVAVFAVAYTLRAIIGTQNESEEEKDVEASDAL